MKEPERLAERCRYGAQKVVPAYAAHRATVGSERHAVWIKPAAIDAIAVHRGTACCSTPPT
jgi:hypothetical protein